MFIAHIMFMLAVTGLVKCFDIVDNVPEDPWVAKMVTEFHDLCPLIPLCSVTVNFSIPLPRDVDIDPASQCCSVCSCSSGDKADYNGCPDVVKERPRNEDICRIMTNNKRIKCMEMSMKSSAFHVPAFFVNGITACPVRNNEQACDSNKEHFDISDENLADFVPVVNTDTGDIFPNRQCAACNGQSMNIAPLQIQVICMGSAAFFPKKITDLNKINDEFMCNILFIPTSPLLQNFRAQQCLPALDTCNMTGRWAMYDADLESMCLAYESRYGDYKNPHCAMCNGEDPRNLTCSIFRPFPKVNFEAEVSLDFVSVDIEPVAVISDVCVEGTCFRPRCGEHMAPSSVGLTCSPIYSIANKLALETNIRFVPTTMTNAASMELRNYLEETALVELRTVTEHIKHVLLSTNCDFDFGLFGKTNATMNDFIEGSPYIIIDYYMIHVRFDIEGANIDVREAVATVNNVVSRLKDVVTSAIVEGNTEANIGTTYDLETGGVMIERIAIPPILKFDYGSTDGYFTDKNGNEIIIAYRGIMMTSMTGYGHVHVSPISICRFVTIGKDGFSRTVVDGQVNLIALGRPACNMTRLAYNSNYTEVNICTDDFIQMHRGNPNKPSQPVNETTDSQSHDANQGNGDPLFEEKCPTLGSTVYEPFLELVCLMLAVVSCYVSF